MGRTQGQHNLKKAINSISKVYREDSRTDITATDQQPIAKEIQQDEEKVSDATYINDEKYETLLARIDSLEQLLFKQQKYINMKLEERDRKNNLKFKRPVYPGDKIHTIAEVINKKMIKSETGILTVLLSTFNDKEEKVFEGELSVLMKL